MEERRTGARRVNVGWTYVVILVGMVIAIAVNTTQFNSIDNQSRHNYQAWHLYNSIDLFEVAITHDGSSRHRTAPFWLIGRQFPNSTFILPYENRASWFEIDLSLVAFGNASSIHYADFDSSSMFHSDRFENFRFPLEEYLPARGGTHRWISDRIGFYLAEPSSGVFVLATPEGNPGREKRMEFVDVFLLLDGSRKREDS